MLSSNPAIEAKQEAQQPISIEFIWKCSSEYPDGQIKVIDIYIDEQRCYSINIPQEEKYPEEGLSIGFKQLIALRMQVSL